MKYELLHAGWKEEEDEEHQEGPNGHYVIRDETSSSQYYLLIRTGSPWRLDLEMHTPLCLPPSVLSSIGPRLCQSSLANAVESVYIVDSQMLPYTLKVRGYTTNTRYIQAHMASHRRSRTFSQTTKITPTPNPTMNANSTRTSR